MNAEGGSECVDDVEPRNGPACFEPRDRPLRDPLAGPLGDLDLSEAERLTSVAEPGPEPESGERGRVVGPALGGERRGGERDEIPVEMGRRESGSIRHARTIPALSVRAHYSRIDRRRSAHTTRLVTSRA